LWAYVTHCAHTRVGVTRDVDPFVDGVKTMFVHIVSGLTVQHCTNAAMIISLMSDVMF
jgi:hypothetical protein